jgi:lysophospholipase L1-like esterase
MQILVLGDSDTTGALTGGVSWPDLLAESLRQQLSTDVNIVSKRLSAIPTNAHTYAAKCLQELSPDLTIIICGSFAFTAKFVYLRIEQLFGKRAGAWYKKFEEGFDSGTKGKSGGRDRLNGLARQLTRRAVGTRGFSTRKQVTENYRAIFKELARQEDMDVIILTYPGSGAHAREGDAPKQRALFFADLQEMAARHHFAYVDTAVAFAEPMKTTNVQTDGLHYNRSGHEIMARAVEGAVLRAARERDEALTTSGPAAQPSKRAASNPG